MTVHIEYNEVYDIIVKYSNHSLKWFANSWNRFPIGSNAYILIDELKKSLQICNDKKVKEDIEFAISLIEVKL